MKFSFRIGKRFGFDRLTDEQKTVVEQLERGEITKEEAERLLGGDVRVTDWKSPRRPTGTRPATSRPSTRRMPRPAR